MAAPTRRPDSALAFGGSAPISARASLSGALSPSCASRAPLSSSRVFAFLIAASAASSARFTSAADKAVTATGS